MSALNLLTTVGQCRRALVAGYSLLRGAPDIVAAAKKKDREALVNDGLYFVRSGLEFIQTYVPVVTGSSMLLSFVLRYNFNFHSVPIPPLVGGAFGTVSCLVDAALEARGLLLCSRLLKQDYVHSQDTFLDALKKTANIQDSMHQQEQRRFLIRSSMPQMHPSSLVTTILSNFESATSHCPSSKTASSNPAESERDIPQNLLQKAWNLLTRFRSTSFSNRQVSCPVSYRMHYDELLQKIEAAVLFSKLKNLQSTYEISSAKEEEIQRQARRKYPYDLDKRKQCEESQLKYKKVRKIEKWKHCVGVRSAQYLKTTIPLILDDLLSDEAITQSTAISKALLLLDDTNCQLQKSQFIYVVGVTAGLISALAFILAMLPCVPLALVLIVTFIGALLYASRYLLACELLENEGWRFSLKSALHRGLLTPIATVIKSTSSKVTNGIKGTYKVSSKTE